MNQELATELYRAGFPSKEYYFDEERGSIYVPTLSELIEACRNIDHDFSIYLEVLREEICWAEARCFGTLIMQAKGATPEEAVSRLWLALNKK